MHIREIVVPILPNSYEYHAHTLTDTEIPNTNINDLEHKNNFNCNHLLIPDFHLVLVSRRSSVYPVP